jgi:hypothetical protein
MLTNYESVSNPSTYEKAPRVRKQEFQLEKDLLRTQVRFLEDQRRRFNEILDECESLSQFILHATEIEKDDQSKAILAFTIVTIIFLPLSFVTSYLGMNTTFDDGTWELTQQLFWQIALPMTFALGAFCLLLAYWEKTTTWLKEKLSQFSLPTMKDEKISLKPEPAVPPKSKVNKRVTFAESRTEEIPV